MPAKDQFGSQPPLELLRQWIDYGFWYDREKQTSNYIKDMQVILLPPLVLFLRTFSEIFKYLL